MERHLWMFSFNTWQFFLLSNSFVSNVSYVSEPVHSIFPGPLARISSRTKLPLLSKRVRPMNTRHPEKCSSKRVPASAQISATLSSRLDLGRAKTQWLFVVACFLLEGSSICRYRRKSSISRSPKHRSSSSHWRSFTFPFLSLLPISPPITPASPPSSPP
jgi:hypothetical protein